MYDYITIHLTGSTVCVFNCGGMQDVGDCYQFGSTFIRKEFVNRVEVSREPGKTETLFDRRESISREDSTAK